MDKKEYLEQLNASVRPTKKSIANGNFFSSKAFKILAGLVGAIIFFSIIGVIINNNKDILKERTIDLKLHLDNTNVIIDNYQQYVKSSELRSSSASLSSILSSTVSQINDYLLDKYKMKKIDKKRTEAANPARDKIESELFTAKINGILDRIYAHKMSYEISLIMSEESTIYRATKDEQLKNILNTSYNSLENLSPKFSDFSEGK